MALGLGVLRLPPTHFWTMTPRELEAALEGLAGPPSSPPPTRTGLADLMRRYPDALPET